MLAPHHDSLEKTLWDEDAACVILSQMLWNDIAAVSYTTYKCVVCGNNFDVPETKETPHSTFKMFWCKILSDSESLFPQPSFSNHLMG